MFRLPKSPIALAGVALATLGGLLFIFTFAIDLLGLHGNPYLGILFFIVFPAIFVAGLLLIPVGLWRERVRRRQGRPEFTWPTIDLTRPQHRRWALFVAAATIVNLLIVSLASYSSVKYMDSVGFCGQVCHVMEPEFVAHQNGPHARVACVACHVGEGAEAHVRSKMAGTRQLVALTFGTYARPIPAPVHNLRPARETCERCHWPDKFHGDQPRVIREYGSDESNTLTETLLDVRVGGGGGSMGPGEGIHWHMNLANRVEYIALDDARQQIPWVRITDASGEVREYQADGVTAEQLAGGERRTMDCLDCHNRPAHGIAPTAARAVDRALALGRLPATLPFIRREAVAALEAPYATRDEAAGAIATRVRAFYQEQQAEVFATRREEVERAVTAVQALYHANVFPAMRVTFGSYPSNIGHMDSPGCFRCHDEVLKTRDGQTIGQDCESCHRFR